MEESPGLTQSVRAFLASETAGAATLLVAAVVAFVWANSPWQDAYATVWSGARLTVVNDGLMTVFFFVVGLEIRRELVRGELRKPRAAALPVIAAVGGMALPALVYTVLNAGHPGSSGWGIPIATDIAFAVGVVALAGARVDSSMKVFLLALAIVDDIGAIVVIAVFYSAGVDGWPLALTIALLVVIRALPASIGGRLPVFVLLAGLTWFATYESGVHATIAGVALAMVVPGALADRLETALHPWTSFAIVPLFALANAGVTLRTSAFDADGAHRVIIGIVVGAVFGKVIGITGAIGLATRARVARLPRSADNRQLLGVAATAGVGFTVALFIAGLAFSPGDPLADCAKIGIVIGSVLAAIAGSLILRTGTTVGPRR